MPIRPEQAPVQLGDYVELEIEAMADGPDAIARLGGYVILVGGALPGERVSAKITSAARKFGRGDVVQVLQPSPHRVAPRCRHYLECGGCHLQHVDHAGQLELKAARLHKELVRELGEPGPDLGPTLTTAEPWQQRHKVALQLQGKGRSLLGGYRQARRIELVPIAECPVSAPAALDLAFAAVALLAETNLAAFDGEGSEGVLRSVLVRLAAATGQSQVILVATSKAPREALHDVAEKLLHEGAASVAINRNDGPLSQLLGRTTIVAAGAERIRERIGDTDHLISPAAFFQTAPAAAAALVTAVRTFLAPTPQDVVADLYCGGGLFALPLARSSRLVIGVEQSQAGIDDARASATLGGVRNVRWLQTDSVRQLAAWHQEELPDPDLVVLDPPRSGCGEFALRNLARLRPRKIAYVSCDPAALAADLAVLQRSGYRCAQVTPVEMFAQTAHIEALATLVPAGRR